MQVKHASLRAEIEPAPAQLWWFPGALEQNHVANGCNQALVRVSTSPPDLIRKGFAR